jgi:hypothetical protein
MKKIATFFLFVLPFYQSFSQSKTLTAAGFLQKMYNKYHGKWHNNLFFTQLTEQYKNDSLVKSDLWYEHILYPETQRIDIDSPKSGNGFIQIKDSLYIFSMNKLVRTIKNDDGVIFLLGGLYFMPFDNVLARFKSLNYDLGKFHVDTWKGKDVYVIGANSNDERVNQLWIDKERMLVLRFIKYDSGTKEDVSFEDQIKLKGGWSETKCVVYINEHLIQVEIYHNLVADGPVDKNMYDPAMIGK